MDLGMTERLKPIHARVAAKVAVGVRKCDLVAEIFDAGTRGVGGFGGDYPALVPLIASGADATAPHLTWDDKPLKAGEGTFFEVATRFPCASISITP